MIPDSDITALARQLFGLSEESTDTSLGMAKAVGGAMIDDLISQTKQLEKRSGRTGFLVLCPTKADERPCWESAEGLAAKIDLAVRAGDRDAAETFRRLLRLFETHDRSKSCLIAIAGARPPEAGGGNYFKAYLLPTDDPHANLLDVLKAAMNR